MDAEMAGTQEDSAGDAQVLTLAMIRQDAFYCHYCAGERNGQERCSKCGRYGWERYEQRPGFLYELASGFVRIDSASLL
jgi:hypothetical protein